MKFATWVVGFGLIAATAGYFFWRASKDEKHVVVLEERPPMTVERAAVAAPVVEESRAVETIIAPGGLRPEEPGRVSADLESVIRPEQGYRRADLAATQKALRGLDAESLTSDEKNALRWFLFEPTADETIRNDTANVLASAKDPALFDTLSALMRDLNQTALWRNYCVQHLSVLGETLEADAQIAAELFHAAENDPAEIVRDCGLLQLSRLAEVKDWRLRNPPLFARVSALAKKFLGSERTEVERISGIRAAGRLGLTEESDKLIACLKDDKPGVRLAAATELGRLGVAADEPLNERIVEALRELAGHEDRMLREAAARALKELQR